MLSKKNIYLSSLYNASTIKILNGLKAVRKRPGMYIGSTEDYSGLYHTIFEVLSNSIDEVMNGFCNYINIILHKDISISIEDQGRGIPIDLHNCGIIACEIILCTLHTGGKFDNKFYEISGGLHGVGLSVVNALSSLVQIDIKKLRKYFRQWYSEGFILSSLNFINSVISFTNSGTCIRLWPDKNIFTKTKMNKEFLLNKLKEQAFLNKHLFIHLIDNGSNKEYDFFFINGLYSFIKEINNAHTVIHINIIYFKIIYKNRKIRQNMYNIEVAMQWNNSYNDNIRTYTNNIYNKNGGTHLIGFKSAITRSFNNYINKFIVKNISKISILGEDIREGLVAILSLKCLLLILVFLDRSIFSSSSINY